MNSDKPQATSSTQTATPAAEASVAHGVTRVAEGNRLTSGWARSGAATPPEPVVPDTPEPTPAERKRLASSKHASDSVLDGADASTAQTADADVQPWGMGPADRASTSGLERAGYQLQKVSLSSEMERSGDRESASWARESGDTPTVMLAQATDNRSGGDYETTGDRASGSWAVESQQHATGGGWGNYGLPALLAGGAALASVVGHSSSGGSTAQAASPQMLKVTALDGKISGATVYVDANGNGIAEASEKVGVTGPNGDFQLTDFSKTGNLLVVGGVNTDTGLPNTQTMTAMGWSATDGTVVVSPLTTLVAAVFANPNQTPPGMSLAQAETAVKLAFGISAGVHLSTFDPQDAANAANPAALKVQQAIAQLAAVSSDTALSSLALSALADYVVTHPNAVVDLSSVGTGVGTLATIYGTAHASTAELQHVADANHAIASATTLTAVTDAQKLGVVPSIVGLHNDTGSIGTDKITADPRLDVAGQALNATIEYSTDGGHNWIAQNQFAPADGDLTVVARLHYDSGYTSGASAPFSFTLNTAMLPALALSLKTDSGVSATDHLTNVADVIVDSPVAGALREFSTDQQHWNTTIPTAVEGSNDLYVRESFPLTGAVSPTTHLSFTLDTHALPGTTGLVHDAINDTGASATDGITSNVQPQLAGLSEAGATAVSVAIAGHTYAVAAADLHADGHWTLHLPEPLVDGTYIPLVSITDLAGNTSAPTAMAPITIDTVAPDAGTAALSASSDSGFSSNDGLTNVTRPTMEGHAEALSSVAVDVNGTTYNATADANGHYQVVVTESLTDGSYTPTVAVTDLAGNVSETVDGTPFTVLATPPQETAPSGLAHEAAIDTGVSSEDGFTSNTLPLVTGSIDTFGTVVIVQLAGHTYTTSSDDTGAWSVQVPEGSELADGTYVPGILYMDAAGNQTHTSGTPITIDTQAPTDATGDLVHDVANDTGVSATDGITNNASPMLEGTTEANALVSVDLNGTAFETTADANGHWTLKADGLADGDYTPKITVADLAGNVSDPIDGTPFTIITTGPAAATGDLVHDAVNDTGVSAEDNITANNKPEYTGTADAGSAVTVDFNGHAFQTVADDAGNWTLQVSTALPDGFYTPSISVTDAAGNVTSSDAPQLTIETVAPNASSVTGGLTHDASSDTGASSTDSVTNNDAPSVSGTSPALALIHVVVDGTGYDTQADEAGAWSVDLSKLADGHYTPVITVVDAAGNQSLPITGSSFTIDTQAPATATGGLVHDAASDTGVSATDGITSNTSPMVTGTAEAGALVSVDLNGTAFETTADASGHWTIKAEGLADGEYAPAITVTDLAGNASDAINGTPFTVNTAGPAAPAGDLVHIDVNDTGVSAEDNITANNKPEYTGTADAGNAVTVDFNGHVFHTLAGADGNWTLQVSTALPDGVYTPVITASDAAGNVTSIDAPQLTIETVAPNASSVAGGLTHDASNDTGASSTDSITNNNAPSVSGTSPALALIHVVVDGTGYDTQADDTGFWSVDLSTLADGTYTPVITVVDAAGNESVPINGTAFTIDTVASSSPVTGGLLHDAVNDTGPDATDGITSNAKPTLAGTADAGSIVSVDLGDGNTHEVTADANGNWTLHITTALPDGTYTPVITVSDLAGNVGDAVDGTPIVIVTHLAPFTGGLTHDDTNDTGVSTTDSITNNNQPQLSGTAEAGATVSVTINKVVYSTTADADGLWTIQTDQVLPDGVYTPTLTVADLAGNTATAPGQSMSIETVAGFPGGDIGAHHVISLDGKPVNINPFGSAVAPADATVTESSGTLPDGLSIDPVTSHIVGTPTAPGVTWISVNGSDLAGNVSTQDFRLDVTSTTKLVTLASNTINNSAPEHSSTYIGTDSGQHLNVYASANDVILAGAGNDLFQLFKPDSLNFARLDGGAGIDRVNFSGTDITMDFADFNHPTGSGRVIEHIEQFYFAGKASSLTVSASDLFHLHSDALDIDGKHEMVKFMADTTNKGTVTLDGLAQVGATDFFGATGDKSSGASNDKFTKFTGIYTDNSGDHLVELLLQHGLTAA